MYALRSPGPAPGSSNDDCLLLSVSENFGVVRLLCEREMLIGWPEKWNII